MANEPTSTVSMSKISNKQSIEQSKETTSRRNELRLSTHPVRSFGLSSTAMNQLRVVSLDSLTPTKATSRPERGCLKTQTLIYTNCPKTILIWSLWGGTDAKNFETVLGTADALYTPQNSVFLKLFHIFNGFLNEYHLKSPDFSWPKA